MEPRETRTVALATNKEQAQETLQAALDIFDGPCSTAVPSGGRQQLRDLAEKHKQAAAKAGLLGSESSSLSDAEVRGMVFALEQSTIALCSYCHGFSADAGPSLKSSLRQLCTAVVEPTKELVEQLAKGDAARLRKSIGLVWGACDELARGPLDNKSCLFRQLADVMQGMKSADKELEELLEVSRRELEAAAAAATCAAGGESDEAGRAATTGDSGRGNDGPTGPTAAAEGGDGGDGGDGSAAGGSGRVRAEGGAEAEGSGRPRSKGSGDDGEHEDDDNDGDGDDDDGDDDDDDDDDASAEEDEGTDSDDFRDMGTLTAVEVRTAAAAMELLKAAQEALRAISRPLLEGPPVTSSYCLDDWESMAWHAGKLRSGCEALVACLYPPHDDLEELKGEAEAVSNTLELMLAEFPEAYTELEGEAQAQAEGQAGGSQAAEAEGQSGGAGLRTRVGRQLEAAQQGVDLAASRLRDALTRAARKSAAGVGV